MFACRKGAVQLSFSRHFQGCFMRGIAVFLLLVMSSAAMAQMSTDEAMRLLLERQAVRESQAPKTLAPTTAPSVSILDAAVHNNVAEVQRWLADPKMKNAIGPGGETALHWAASYGAAEAADALIKGGITVDAKANGGMTPLHLAAQEGQTKVVTLLLNARAAANRTNDDGLTPLHLAATGGHVEVVELLLAAGASITATDDTGSTPLHLAAAYGQGRVVDALLKHGADPNAVDADGRTPIALAEANKHPELAVAMRSPLPLISTAPPQPIGEAQK
jgi:ankyrin repeat protein